VTEADAVRAVADRRCAAGRWLLEPGSHHAVKPFKDALRDDGIPVTMFAVAGVQAEFEPRARSVSGSVRNHWLLTAQRQPSSMTPAAT